MNAQIDKKYHEKSLEILVKCVMRRNLKQKTTKLSWLVVNFKFINKFQSAIYMYLYMLSLAVKYKWIFDLP